MLFIRLLKTTGLLLAFVIASASANAEIVTIKGTVKSVDIKKRTITVESDGKTKDFDVSSKAKVAIEGKDSLFDSLKEGQKISLSYHDDLDVVLKIEVGTASGISSNRKAELVEITELKIGPGPGYTAHSLTPDGLTIYFDGPEGLIWTAHRRSAEERFENQASTQIKGRQPTISNDELELIFVAFRRDGKKGESLHLARRDRNDQQFRRPTEIAALVDKDGQSTAKNAYLSPDGLTLYFNLYTPDGTQTSCSTRTKVGDGWSRPRSLLVTQDRTFANWPFVSSDSRFMLAFEAILAKDKDRQTRGLAAWHRDSINDKFVLQQIVTLPDGGPIEGRCPRYVAATKELFFAGNVGSETGIKMFCITSFDTLVPEYVKAFSN